MKFCTFLSCQKLCLHKVWLRFGNILICFFMKKIAHDWRPNPVKLSIFHMSAIYNTLDPKSWQKCERNRLKQYSKIVPTFKIKTSPHFQSSWYNSWVNRCNESIDNHKHCLYAVHFLVVDSSKWYILFW